MAELSNMVSGDLNSLKRMNRLHIMNLLRSKGALSRTQLANLSGLNNKTITNIINDLLANRVVVSVGLQKSDTGRKKEHFKLNNRLFYSIGIDIGASHITVILIDLEGQIIHEKSFNFRYGLKGSIILEKLTTLTGQLIDSLQFPGIESLALVSRHPAFSTKPMACGTWPSTFPIGSLFPL